jgi:hypothetical protein
MRRVKYPLAAIAAALALAFFTAAPADAQPQGVPPEPANADPGVVPPDYNCVNCHLEMAGGEPTASLDPDTARIVAPVDDWMGSVHREVGVRCADCHGGDPVDDSLAMEPDAGFIGKPAKADIPALCATCHNDARMMRRHNQRSDQLDLYQGSIHGARLLRQGDAAAPSCVDCHGKHDIRRVKDPQATVNRANVAETCGGCHADKTVFEPRRQRADALELYKKSWHYEKFSEGDLLVPTCVDCHGNHAVMPARTERTQTVCFKCHSEQAEYFKASPHWQAFQKDGEPVCLHCHKNHDITRPSVAHFTGEGDNDCIACHDTDSPAYQAGAAIAEAVGSAVKAVSEATDGLTHLEEDGHGGFETSHLDEAMTKAQEGLKSLRTLTHKLDVDAVKKDSEPIIAVAQHVSGRVDEFWSEITTRKVGLAGAWLIFLGLAGSIWVWTKEVDKGRDE